MNKFISVCAVLSHLLCLWCGTTFLSHDSFNIPVREGVTWGSGAETTAHVQSRA